MQNSESLETIFDKNFNRIYRFFFYKTYSREEAEDLTSETFLAFADKVKALTDIENFEDYLFGISRHIFMNYLRKKYQMPQESLSNYPDVTVEVSEIETNLPSLKDVALKHLSKLPEKQAQVLKLRLIEGKTLSEIAALLEKDMNYVKTTQKRAIHSLKKLLACTPLAT